MKQSVSKEISTSLLEGKLIDVVKNIQDLIAEYGDQACLELGTERGYYEDHSVSASIVRIETDEEEMLREMKQAEYKIAMALRRREEYERLKKEFGE